MFGFIKKIFPIRERPAYVSEIKGADKSDYMLSSIGEMANIININKGGQKSMTKTIVKAQAGFERIFDELNAMKSNLDTQKELAKAEALAEVDRRFETEKTRIDTALATVSTTEEIEVPDEIVAEEQPVVE